MVIPSKVKKNIISVSRRSDIPLFFSNNFRKYLNNGFVEFRNPFSNKKVNVILSPETVAGFVFWTRYPRFLIKTLDIIDNHFGVPHYVLLTYNKYPKDLEPFQISESHLLDTIEKLVARYGIGYVKWRFDPIVISEITDESWIYRKFEQNCKTFEGLVTQCITSFVDFYPKVQKRFAKLKKKCGLAFYDPDFETKHKMISNLREISRSFNIKLQLCCEREIAVSLKIEEASCVNPFDLKLPEPDLYKRKPTRDGCNCYESIDIGTYNTCRLGCVYCYASGMSRV